MKNFIVYNKITKHIIDKEFEDYDSANTFIKTKLTSDYEVKFNNFDDIKQFKSMLRNGLHFHFMLDKNGVCGIMHNDVFLHCGYISDITLYMLKLTNTNIKEISKLEFIKLHNELISSILN